MTTKHLDSLMSLGFVAFNGKKMPFIWFKKDFWLKAADCLVELREKFIPWVRENFSDGNVVLQQDEAPAHTAKALQDFLAANIDFWSKDFWPPYLPECNQLDYAFWPHIKSKVCKRQHSNTAELCGAVDAEWDSMTGLHCEIMCLFLQVHLCHHQCE